jgi:hypothetical protein
MPIKAIPGQAKIRTAPRNFNRPGPVILVKSVDGQQPVSDKRDYSTVLTPGHHQVELDLIQPSGQAPAGELVALLAKKLFANREPPAPQTMHHFVAESGHDYLIRWSWDKSAGREAIWIEDYDRGGQPVSGIKDHQAPTFSDPFRAR